MRKCFFTAVLIVLFSGLSVPNCVMAQECLELLCTESSILEIEDIKEAGDGESSASFADESFEICEDAELLGAGWVTDDRGTRYINDRGEYVSDAWVYDKGHYYYLGEDTYLVKDRLINYGNDIYYVDKEGKRYTAGFIMLPADDQDRALLKVDHRWYFFPESGKALRSVSRKIDGKYYSFDQDGKRLFGFTDGDRNILTGRYPAVGAEYYFGTIDDGTRYTGFLDSETAGGMRRFYFGYNGVKVYDRTLTIEGRQYSFDSDGCMMEGWSYDPVGNIYRYYSTDGEDKGALKKNTWLYTVPHENMSYEDHMSGTKRWFYLKTTGSPATDLYKISLDGEVYRYMFTGSGILCTGLLRVFEEHDQIRYYEENLERFTSAHIKSIQDSRIIYAYPKPEDDAGRGGYGGRLIDDGKVKVNLSDGNFSMYFRKGLARNGNDEDGNYINGFRTDPHTEMDIDALTNNQSVLVRFDTLVAGAYGNPDNYFLEEASGKPGRISSADHISGNIVRINFPEPLCAGSYTLHFCNGSLNSFADFVIELDTSVYEVCGRNDIIIRLSSSIVGCTDPGNYYIYPAGQYGRNIQVESAVSAYYETGGVSDTFRLTLGSALESGRTYVIETRNMRRWAGDREGGRIGNPCQGTIAYLTHEFPGEISVYALTNNQSILFRYDIPCAGMYDKASYTVRREVQGFCRDPEISSVTAARVETGEENTVKINFTEPLDVGTYNITTRNASGSFTITLKLSPVRPEGKKALIIRLSSPIVGCTDASNYKVVNIDTRKEYRPVRAVSAFEETGHLPDSFRLDFAGELPAGTYSLETRNMRLWKDGREGTEPGGECQGTIAYITLKDDR